MWVFPQLDPREYPALVLAYIGDAVYELYIRMYLVDKGVLKVNELHNKSASLVKAANQACFLRKMEPNLSDTEIAVVKRGRNAKTTHIPKNANLIDYKLSTGFESLIGYLFLVRKMDRIKELMDFCLVCDND